MVYWFYEKEAEKLSLVEENQGLLRASDCSGLREFFGDSSRLEDEVSVVSAGRIFPSINMCSWRAIHMQQMPDVIAISNNLEHADFFVTILCCLKWQEIERALFLERISQINSELAGRVFMMKKTPWGPSPNLPTVYIKDGTCQNYFLKQFLNEIYCGRKLLYDI